MGNVVLIACTNVGRSMIEAIMNDSRLKDVHLTGIVNLKPETATGKANYDSYVDLAGKYGLNIYYCENVNEPSCVSFLKECRPDIIIQSGWSQKFRQEILDIPTYACIGEHPAPLPKGRGAACVNWAILTGEHEWGDTFFQMEMQSDTGLISAQEFFNIELYDDVKTVYDKVALCAVRTIRKHLPAWTAGKLDGVRQDDTKATHYPRRRPTDGEFAFADKPALELYNFIRAQAKPYPGAYFIHKGKKVYVWQARLSDDLRPEEHAVICGDGKSLILCRVQQEGEPEMWAADYFAGHDINQRAV